MKMWTTAFFLFALVGASAVREAITDLRGPDSLADPRKKAATAASSFLKKAGLSFSQGTRSLGERK